jgi:hypothetical protein
MFGNRSRQDRPSQGSDPLTGPGTYILFLGGVMFILPTYFHTSWIFTSWLGGMEPPIGLALMVVGGAMAIAGLVRGRVTRTTAEPPALDPNVVLPPPGPVVGGIGSGTAPATPPGPGMTANPAQPTQPALPAPPAPPASAPGLGIDAPPPPLEPLYRPPTSMDDLRPPGSS